MEIGIFIIIILKLVRRYQEIDDIESHIIVI